MSNRKPGRVMVVTNLQSAETFAEELRRQFGSGSTVAMTMIVKLGTIVIAGEQERPGGAFEGWNRDYFQLCGQETDLANDLWKLYPMQDISASQLLFCIHVYCAIILKLVAAEFAGKLARGGEAKSFLATLLEHRNAGNEIFTRDLTDLESGDLFTRWLGISNFPGDARFSWYVDTMDAGLADAIVSVVETLSSILTSIALFGKEYSQDVFTALYQDLIPGSIRHGLGEYYTPAWLAAFLLDKLHFTASGLARLASRKHDPQAPFVLKVLDPSCGSGTFLIEAVARLQRYATRHDCLDTLAACMFSSVGGFDLNPIAVLAAKVNYMLVAGDLIARAGANVELPVYEIDPILASIDSDHAIPPCFARNTDIIIGNPPWVLWDNVHPAYLEMTRSWWTLYGLDKYTSSITRQLALKRDISILFTYACVDKLTKEGGRIGFLITQSVFKSKGAGETFRHFQYAEPASDDVNQSREAKKVSMRIDVVHDFTIVQPFTGASTKTTAFVATKGAETQYPVRYYEWERNQGAIIDPGDMHAMDKLHFRLKRAMPADTRNPCSPWLTVPRDALPAIEKMRGQCYYDVFEGINTGGANGIFYLDISGIRDLHDNVVDGHYGPGEKGLVVMNQGHGKSRISSREATIEEFFIHPFIKSRNVKRWGIEGYGYILQMQDPAKRIGYDEAWVKSRYPLTYRYLDGFRDALLARKSKYIKGMLRKGAFYSMINVSSALLTPWKVIWNRMGASINACVAGTIDDAWLGPKTVIPDDVLAYIPVDDEDEAHYICAVMNSTTTRFLLESIAGGSKSLGTPTIVKDTIHIDKYSPENPVHVQLANKSRKAHELAICGTSRGKVEQEIDGLVARMDGLSETDISTFLAGT